MEKSLINMEQMQWNCGIQSAFLQRRSLTKDTKKREKKKKKAWRRIVRHEVGTELKEVQTNIFEVPT